MTGVGAAVITSWLAWETTLIVSPVRVMLGHSTRERRVDVELALQACGWLRAAVLTEAEPV